MVCAFFEFFTDEDAGVVYEDVELAEAFYGGVYGIAPAIFAGDVEGDEEGLTAGVVYFGGDFLSLLMEDVAEDDMGAFFGEEASFGGAHASGGTGDEGNFAFQAHDFSPIDRVGDIIGGMGYGWVVGGCRRGCGGGKVDN